LIRLIFVLALAIAVGVGIYYGVSAGIPALDRLYVQPVRNNTNDIANLEARSTQLVEQSATQMAGLQERLTELEVQSDNNKVALAEMDARFSTIEPSLTAQEELAIRLDDLETLLTTLDETLTADLATQSTALASLEDSLNASQSVVNTLRRELEQDDFPSDEVFLELQIVKAMSLLTRSQVFLFQSNFGLAVQDIETARELLSVLSALPVAEAISFEPILTRLDLILTNLPSQPEQAQADLEVAWNLLIDGLERGVSGAEATETPVPTSEGTSSPELTPTPTSTP
jgi:hypothetical protein